MLCTYGSVMSLDKDGLPFGGMARMERMAIGAFSIISHGLQKIVAILTKVNQSQFISRLFE